MPERARRLSRLGDLAGILLVLAGFLGYLWIGGALRSLEHRAGAPGGTTPGALAEVERLATLSRAALGLAAIGIAVLILTALIHQRARRRAAAQLAEAAGASTGRP